MTIEEPSYLMFAKANVRDGLSSSPSIVRELLARLERAETAKQPEPQKPDHSFRVVHERTGAVATDCVSYIEAATVQYHGNQIEQREGRQPLWRMWLIDSDGVGCTVNTQQPTR